MDIIDKLHDYNRILDKKHELLLKEDSTGTLAEANFPFNVIFTFDSIQDCREKMYKGILNSKNKKSC